MALGQLAGHRADQVMHVGVALQGKQLRYADRAGLAAATQVVAQQVDDHQVLGTILGAADQLIGIGLVVCSAGTARAGALDRSRLHAPPADLQETLR